ncbi:MAG: hypothetical protein ACFB50_02825 [Rubrobacteraceae bacterium]
MSRLTFGFGVVLVLIGVVTYFATGGASVTALIPAFIGVPVLVAGFLTARPGTRSLGLYLATALALLMAFGTLRGVSGLFEGDFSSSTVINLVLLLMSAGYLVVAAREIFTSRRGGSFLSGG